MMPQASTKSTTHILLIKKNNTTYNMTYDEIVEKEKRENSEDLYKIHLYLENDWWRAHEWSAYLCHLFPNDLSNDKKLKPTHKDSKSIENGIVLVGLKLASFEKYLPNTSIVNVDNKHISIDVSVFIKEEFSLDSYATILNSWKESIPFSKTEKVKQNKPIIKEPPKESIMSIMQEVLAYPIENKTLIENTTFIGHLKSELIKLI